MTLTSHPFMLANTAQSSTRGNSNHTTQERCAMYAAHTRRVTTTLTHAHPLSAIRCRRSSDKRLRSANNNSTQIRPHTTSRAGPPTGAWGGSGDPAQTKAQILIRLAWTKAWYSSDQPQTRAQSSLDRPLATALQLKPSTHQIRPEPAPDRVPGASR